MKIWAIRKRGDVSRLTQMELAKPQAAEGMALVKVAGAALNPADLKVLRGGVGYILHANGYPLHMGYDFAGVVEEAAQGFRPGDEVFGFLPYSTKNRQGSFGDYISVPVAQVARKPRSLGFPEAASLATTGSTALQVLRDKAKLKPGQRVLINGASGGVGSAAVQVAKLLGATVWGVCSAGKMAFVQALGADEVVDYRATRLQDIAQRFDAVFDVAANSSFMTCSPIMNSGGHYIALLPSAPFMAGMIASLFSSKSCGFITVAPKAADLAVIAQWADAGRLKPQVEKTYPIGALPDAFMAQASSKVKGKIAVAM